jgi:dimethylhistidine N-methyltransferase
MKTDTLGEVVIHDFEPTAEKFKAEFVAGLRRRPKLLPCKFFYDKHGSELFDQICGLDEYYLTRTETEIIRTNIDEIAARCGRQCVLVELGSGSSSKTRLLLKALKEPIAYVPIDISRSDLLRATESLNGDYTPLAILPVCADYNAPLTLPAPVGIMGRTVMFFPGSTIGNFDPKDAVAFLRHIASWCEPGAGLLVGVDLEKSREVLHPAYNDARGVTAAFNRNILQRANSELGANFAPEQFFHEAIYNDAKGRIEMGLVSCCHQCVAIAGEEFEFESGEHVTTEYSYKYRLNAFHELASSAGWQPEQTWTDKDSWFSVNYLTLKELSIDSGHDRPSR